MDTSSPATPIELSAIIAVHNDGDVVADLFREVLPALEGLERTFEVVFVDDGSTDDTAAVLQQLFQENECVRVVRFARHFGVQLANSAGMRATRGSKVLIVDARLQVSPDHLSEFMDKLDEGYDIVYADSRLIPLPLYRRAGRKAALWLIRRLTGIAMPDTLSGITGLNDRLVKEVNRYTEKRRTLDTLFAEIAYGRYAKVPVTLREGAPSRAGYTPWQMVREVLSMIVSHSVRPLLVAFWAGIVVLALSAALGGFWIFRVATVGWEASAATMLTAIVVFLAGLQLVAMGVLGEYVGRIYGEVLGRPLYTIAEIYEHKEEEAPVSERT